ncbi:putative polyketide synthase protein [Botrytis fragariae]|uniref:Putative polyketide synthase protein n=1 Tax=Botrytis fragariae TaxID=1964551 RepID=A0A8H6AWL1_9HELO|nr:putative polyketide synthase protein [Botrytis fragariae]KAF5874834.1 putative polyketide synthase protein [Botrytis fragariae]
MSTGNLKEVMRLLQSGKTSGKIALSVDGADIIPNFDSKSSSIIEGGLGGLDRSAALWMADKGAKYLILLSRSGPATNATISWLIKLRAMVISIEAPNCGITSFDQLRKAISQCSKAFPPG